MNIHLGKKPFYPTRHSHKHYNRNVYTGQDKAKQNYVNTKIIPQKKSKKRKFKTYGLTSLLAKYCFMQQLSNIASS